MQALETFTSLSYHVPPKPTVQNYDTDKVTHGYYLQYKELMNKHY